MRKLMLLAGATALAVAVPASAQGNGKGKGKGGGGHPVAEAHHPGNGKGRGGKAHQQRQADRSGGKGQRRTEQGARKDQSRAWERAAKNERKAVQRAAKDDRRAIDRIVKDERKAVQRAAKDERRAYERMARNDRAPAGYRDRVERNAWRDGGQRDTVRWADDRRRADYRHGGYRQVVAYRDGCPPGLAKKNAFCMPPGQLRKAHLIGQAAPATFAGYQVPERYRYRFAAADGYDYRWDDEGYVYRVDQRTNIIQSVIPVLASGLLVGEPMPLGFDAYNVPFQSRDRFADTDEWMYRYDDQAIYRVNPQNRLVEGIVQLLAGGSGLNIGQMLPSGFDAYNLPLQYRDQYQDSPDHMYRYVDGNIYDVDPTSGIIQQIISAIL